jgi:AbrB family looped-hinge helix DNA binding protein
MLRVRLVIDSKGRILLPKSVREKLGLREGDEVELAVVGDKLVISKLEDPFKVLEGLLGDLTFDRSLRVTAEEEALRQVKRRIEGD